MELFERQRYYHCRHCGSFHFIETEERDGVRALGGTTDRTSCPLCGAALTRALVDDRYPVEHCARCRGVLMPRATFGTVIASRRANASGAGVSPVPLDQRELQRHLVCPACHASMDVHPYAGPGAVVIDTCSRCDLIWLDRGELKQISDAPGRDRGAGTVWELLD
jgi:Zn-finger nucleic acid-binding protein